MAEKKGFTPEEAKIQEGRIHDVDKAHEMASAEKPFREAADKAAEKAAVEYEAGRETYPATPALQYVTSQLEVARTALEQKRESAEYSQWGEKPYRFEIEHLAGVRETICQKLQTQTEVTRQKIRMAEIAGYSIDIEEAIHQQLVDYIKETDKRKDPLSVQVFSYGVNAGHPDAHKEILKAFGVLEENDELDYLSNIPEKKEGEHGRGRIPYGDLWHFTLPTKQDGVSIRFTSSILDRLKQIHPEDFCIEITPKVLAQEMAAHLEKKEA